MAEGDTGGDWFVGFEPSDDLIVQPVLKAAPADYNSTRQKKRADKLAQRRQRKLERRELAKKARRDRREAIARGEEVPPLPPKKRKPGPPSYRLKTNFNHFLRDEAQVKSLQGLRVVIDMGVDDVQSDMEIRSLSNQVKYAYGMNLRYPQPFRFTLTSYGGRSTQALEKIAGFDKWVFDREARPYEEVYPTERLVYLSPDSEDVLMTLNKDDIYVIGGLCDYKRIHKFTLDRAKERRVRTARLPLKEFLTGNYIRILTVNQVFLILCEFSHSNDWVQALRAVLPSRKLKTTNLGAFDPAAEPATATAPGAAAAAPVDGENEDEEEGESEGDEESELSEHE